MSLIAIIILLSKFFNICIDVEYIFDILKDRFDYGYFTVLFSYPNLPLDMNMYHLQVELSAVQNYPMHQQQHELRESFTQYQLFTTQMYIKS